MPAPAPIRTASKGRDSSSNSRDVAVAAAEISPQPIRLAAHRDAAAAPAGDAAHQNVSHKRDPG